MWADMDTDDIKLYLFILLSHETQLQLSAFFVERYCRIVVTLCNYL